ncbi:hypothetical protein WAI453_011545 [Rhynchosporium graminicola]
MLCEWMFDKPHGELFEPKAQILEVDLLSRRRHQQSTTPTHVTFRLSQESGHFQIPPMKATSNTPQLS